MLLTRYHSVVTDSIEAIADRPRTERETRGWTIAGLANKGGHAPVLSSDLTLYRASVKPVSRFCSLRASAPWQTCSLDRVPGCLAYIGNGEASMPLHNPTCDFNDEAIPYGVRYFASLFRQQLRLPGISSRGSRQ